MTWANAYDGVHFRAEWGEGDEPPVPDGSSMSWTWKAFDHDKVKRLLLDHFVADWRDVVRRIGVPTLIVTGRFSPYYDLEGMEWFASEMRDGRLAVFEESGHSPHVTEAGRFNRELLDFVRRHPAS